MLLTLRPTTENDLETLFVNQLDEEANFMAAFSSDNPADKGAYMARWSKIIQNETVKMQSIFIDGNTLSGSVLSFEMGDEINVSYWIGKQFWGQGIATQALRLFIDTIELRRPLHGRTAFDNIGSQHVLTKCGFVPLAREMGYANARKKEIEEIVFILTNTA